MKMKIEVEKLSKYKYVHINGIFILVLFLPSRTTNL